MAVDSDKKLTDLAAEILRDAVQVFDRTDTERWLADFNPFAAWSGMDVTGGFSTITGGLAVATGAFPALTGAFAAMTTEHASTGSSLRTVFGLGGRLPAVRLLPAGELAAHARSAPLMMKLEELARWLGRDGRRVTVTEELRESDAADAAARIGVHDGYLPYLWEYALTSGWFELVDEPDGAATWAVLGPTAWRWADRDETGTVHVWAVVFAAVLAQMLNVAAALDPGLARRLNFQGQGVVVAIMLFLARKAGMSYAEVRDLVKEGTIGEVPRGRARRAWDAWQREHGDPARRLLGDLVALRAVAVPDTDDGPVRLMPLALWALRTQLRREAIEVPVLPATVAQMSAANVVALSEGVSDGEFDAEAAAWIAARGPDRAARELLAFAAFSGPSARLAAVNLARRIGARAHLAWREAMQRQELRGYARIALSVLASELPGSTVPLVLAPNPDDLTWVATDLLSLACGDDEPDPGQIAAQFREAVPRGQESWIFDLMSRSSHPDVVRVLTVLGQHHPDRRIARDARQAALAAARRRTLARPEFVPARSGGH